MRACPTSLVPLPLPEKQSASPTTPTPASRRTRARAKKSSPAHAKLRARERGPSVPKLKLPAGGCCALPTPRPKISQASSSAHCTTTTGTTGRPNPEAPAQRSKPTPLRGRRSSQVALRLSVTTNKSRWWCERRAVWFPVLSAALVQFVPPPTLVRFGPPSRTSAPTAPSGPTATQLTASSNTVWNRPKPRRRSGAGAPRSGPASKPSGAAPFSAG